MRALEIHAGPAAARHLHEHGLRAADVALVAGAAAGPKGLVLSHLDRYLFGDWLPRAGHPVHLLGASIGAWRFTKACLADPAAALAQLAHDYAHESYAHPSGKWPPAEHVTAVMRRRLARQLEGREAEILSNPHFRLHVVASRGCHAWLARGGRLGTLAGYAGALAANLRSRRALGGWLERVVFSDPRDPLPLALDDYRSCRVPLSPANLREAVLASCSIPFWLEAVRGIAGAPDGPYWDGGITDYHLHLDYPALGPGRLVLYPHLQSRVVPGWLDKWLPHRHRATARLANVVLLVPSREWIRTLPGGKLPDRSDFERYGRDEAGRVRAWTRAVDEAERLADEFATLVGRPGPVESRPLA